MSSFSATFKLDGNEYDVMYYSYSFGQSTDNVGRPASDVKAGRLNMALSLPQDGSATAPLMAWMLNAYGPKNGSLECKRTDQDSVWRTISFEEGYCVSLTESFNGSSNRSMNVNISVSAKKITAKDVTHEKKW